MKDRTLALALKKAVKTFPAVVVTGPRQSGKTTLLKTVFGKTHKFVSLENPDMRLRARQDPLMFLEQYNAPVIIDEIQYVPDLLSYIKTKIDEDRKPGRWLFTGSQNFALMAGVSQSLAGRAAVMSLLPFSYAELSGAGSKTMDIDRLIGNMGPGLQASKKFSLADVILRGAYPEPAANRAVDRQLWCGSYISTYLERDVRNLAHIGDFQQFETFLKVCASLTGQILNMSDISRDLGVSVPTIKRWLSVLETGYQIYLLYPYYRNVGKRFVKSPKLYFTDTGLAAYLLGINSEEALFSSPGYGALFETFVVMDFLKRFLHSGQKSSMYYLRTQDGLEVDLCVEKGHELHLFEIKSAMTITHRHASSLVRAMADLKGVVKSASLVSGSDDNFSLRPGVVNFSWRNILGV
ncbi:MAG: ATP-binding protein [Elusimicrobia bacterium]|nr:ATP-binding protein [Elusimicrobiota bacterium]